MSETSHSEKLAVVAAELAALEAEADKSDNPAFKQLVDEMGQNCVLSLQNVGRQYEERLPDDFDAEATN